MAITPGTLGGKPELVLVNPDQPAEKLPGAASTAFKVGDLLVLDGSGNLTHAIAPSAVTASQGVTSAGNLGDIYFCSQDVTTGSVVDKDADRVHVYKIQRGSCHVLLQVLNAATSAGAVGAATNTTRAAIALGGSYRICIYKDAGGAYTFGLSITTGSPDVTIVGLPPRGLTTDTYTIAEVSK